MVDDFILGTFLASLLGFVFLYILRRSATAKADKRRRAVGAFNDEIRNDCVRSSANGEVRPEGGPETDVIVVGAGVAGAALAHTLGKVRDLLYSFRKNNIPSEKLLLCPVCFHRKRFPGK